MGQIRVLSLLKTPFRYGRFFKIDFRSFAHLSVPNIRLIFFANFTMESFLYEEKLRRSIFTIYEQLSAFYMLGFFFTETI